MIIIGAIQIIRDNLEVGSVKVSRDSFSENIRLHFGIFDCLKHSFMKSLNDTSHNGGGGGVYKAMSPNDTRRGWGLKLDKKVLRII